MLADAAGEMIRLYLQVTAYAARREGLWDEMVMWMDECDTRRELESWWQGEQCRKLVGRMPPEWRELAEEEYWRRHDLL